MASDQKNIQAFLRETRVQEVMASPVITVQDTDDFALVQEKLSLYDIRHLPVVEEHGLLVGLISQRDLYKIHSPRRLEDGTWYYDKDALNQFILKNVMHCEPFTMKPEQSLYEAMDATTRFKFGCIPIVDEDYKPCGILTRDQILNFLIIA